MDNLISIQAGLRPGIGVNRFLLEDRGIFQPILWTAMYNENPDSFIGCTVIAAVHDAPVAGCTTMSPHRWLRHIRQLSCAVLLLWSCAPANAASVEALKNLSIDELMNVEVTSVSRYPERIAAAPSAIQIVTQDDIRRSGATRLPDALRLASNLQVAQKNSHDWGISARGFDTELSNKLLVMIDGRTVYTPLFSGVFWSVQDYLLEDVDRIEVISGPGGTLWGANAVNGVINIITRRAQDTQGLYLEAGAGNELEDFAGLRYGGAIGADTKFRVYGKYYDREAGVFANGGDAADASRMGQGGFRIDSQLSERNTLTMQGDLYGGAQDLPARDETRTSGGNVLGRWTQVSEDNSDMSLQVYYDYTHLVEYVPALTINSITFAPSGTFRDNLSTYDIDFQQRLRPGEVNRWTWGLGYRNTDDEATNAPALAVLPPSLNHNLYSGFLQDEIRLRNNLSLTLGTKIEHNDYTGFEFEPSARLQWTLSQDAMLWAAVSRAVRTPSRVDRDLSEATPPRLVLLQGSSQFSSETVIAYELGYRAQFSSTFAMSAAVFYNDYDDLRSTSVTPVTLLPFYFANNLRGKTQGVELTGTYQALAWWRLHAGYNFLHEEIRIKPGAIDLNNALNETADPKHQASLRSSMDLPGQLELNVNLRWVDELHNNSGPVVGTVPSYFEADVRIGWQPVKKLEVSVLGQNLIHDHHPEYGFPSPTRAEISRSVAGKVTWAF